MIPLVTLSRVIHIACKRLENTLLLMNNIKTNNFSSQICRTTKLCGVAIYSTNKTRNLISNKFYTRILIFKRTSKKIMWWWRRNYLSFFPGYFSLVDSWNPVSKRYLSQKKWLSRKCAQTPLLTTTVGWCWKQVWIRAILRRDRVAAIKTSEPW